MCSDVWCWRGWDSESDGGTTRVKMSWLQRIWFWIRKISNMVFMNRKKSTFACCRLRGLWVRSGLTKLTTHCHSMNSSHSSLATEELSPRRQISLTHLGRFRTSQRILRIPAHYIYYLILCKELWHRKYWENISGNVCSNTENKGSSRERH